MSSLDLRVATYIGAMPDEVCLPGSTLHLCARCLGPCYLSPAGQAHWRSTQGRIVCRRCAPKDGVRDAECDLLPGSREELRQAGFSDRQIKKMLKFSNRYLQGKARWPGDPE